MRDKMRHKNEMQKIMMNKLYKANKSRGASERLQGRPGTINVSF